MKLSDDKAALLDKVTARLTRRGVVWMGLLDEHGKEPTSATYARHRLPLDWADHPEHNFSFPGLGETRILMAALYDTKTGGEPIARMRLSAGPIPVRAKTTLHVAATFPPPPRT